MGSVVLDYDEAGVASLRLNRPQALNALTWEAMQRFSSAVDELAEQDQLRAVIVYGAGRAFCSGGDLFELHQFPTFADGARLAAIMGEALDRLASLPVPTLAAVEGAAFGGGAEIAVACDVRVFSQSVRFGMMHAKLAIAPAWGGGQRLQRLVGHAQALLWTTAAEVIDADTAYRTGLAQRVVEEGQAYDTCRDLAARIASLDPAAIRAIKRSLLAGLKLDSASARQVERDAFAPLWAAEPHLKASETFVSRRDQQPRAKAS